MLAPHFRPRLSRVVARTVLAVAFAWVAALIGEAGQTPTLVDGAYSAAQAARGEQTYKVQCATCHGDALQGVVGPPLVGDAFLAVWAGRSLAELTDKIAKTMPPAQPGSVSTQQAIDIVASMLRAGKFPTGQADLGPTALAQVAFPASRAPASSPTSASSLVAASNLAQLMRAVTFPNANILFNVQVKDPGKEKPSMPVPFDYVLWGGTVYYGWQAVDQAALTLVETTPLFLLPGRRCENGRPVPIDRADWKKYTDALVDAGRTAYRAAQTRNVDAVIKIAEQLNDTCANCHKVYRDGTREGTTAGAARCQ